MCTNISFCGGAKWCGGWGCNYFRENGLFFGLFVGVRWQFGARCVGRVRMAHNSGRRGSRGGAEARGGKPQRARGARRKRGMRRIWQRGVGGAADNQGISHRGTEARRYRADEGHRFNPAQARGRIRKKAGATRPPLRGGARHGFSPIQSGGLVRSRETRAQRGSQTRTGTTALDRCGTKP